MGEKIDGSLKEQIQKLVEETREAISKDNFQEIKAASDKLQNEIMNIGKQAYEGKNDESKGDNDSVIDADFAETK